MKFSEVLGALEAGKRVRRKAWVTTSDEYYLHRDSFDKDTSGPDLLTSDWEVVSGEPADRENGMTAKEWRQLYNAECERRVTDMKPLRETIARLERELREARGAYRELRSVAENNDRILSAVTDLIEKGDALPRHPAHGVDPTRDPGAARLGKEG